MKLEQLVKPFRDRPEDELMRLMLDIRSNRLVSKRQLESKPKERSQKETTVDVKTRVKSMSQSDAANLLSLLLSRRKGNNETG